MNFMLLNCPSCHRDLSESATFAGGDTYCQCGWSSRSMQDKMQKQDETKRSITLVLSAFIIVLLGSAYVYLTTISGQIFYIQQKVAFGMAAPSDFHKLSELCLQMGDEKCALNSLKASSLMQPERLDTLLELARFQMQVDQFSEAAITYKTYLEKGGEDQDVLYRIGYALEKAGDRQEARRYYEQALTDRPGSLNLNATKGLVRLFIEEGNVGEAKNLIAEFQKQTNSQTPYFSDELLMIEMAAN